MSDFWARRKAAVAKEAAVEQAALQAEEVATAEAELAERSDEDLLEEAKLPSPEELDSAEAVREFMNSALPQRLKTRALRQLWKLNPVLANLDGLVDYGEDFTDSATVIENLQTAYQVGKGMLRHVEVMAAKAEAEAQAEDAPAVVASEKNIAENSEEIAAEIPDHIQDADAEDAPLPVEEPEPIAALEEKAVADAAPVRRRMQFQFEGAA